MKTVQVKCGFWLDKKTGNIHMTIPGGKWFHSAVSNNPDSALYHPSLYKNLQRLLREKSG